MSHRHQVVALTKLIDYILRHRPDEFGLVLDEEGFCSIKDLQQAIAEEEGWSYVRRSHILEAAYSGGKGGLEVEDSRIRAKSFARREYTPVSPPPILYHAVRRRAYPHVVQRGLVPAGKPFLTLATSAELASRIGKRRDPDPVVIEVQARRAQDSGTIFYQAGELIYLAGFIPPDFIKGPPVAKVALPKEKGKARVEQRSSAPPRELPGSVLLNLRMEPLYDSGKVKAWKEQARRLRRKRKYI